ncbi:MAG: alpha-ribazole phosphatase family protein, partial [Paludibacter sp.]|nr:alpha-ribazole phosphatase family protein [Paludibacter sp.]
MEITLIRHTSVNVDLGICYGQSDVEVSSNFETEAKRVAELLKDEKYDAVFCSPLSRCTILANFCGFSNPILDERLMELNFGDWEMKAWNDINDPQLRRWYSGWINEIPTNGESFKEQILRVSNFIFELHNTGYKSIAIFAHAGVIRSFGVI